MAATGGGAVAETVAQMKVYRGKGCGTKVVVVGVGVKLGLSIT